MICLETERLIIRDLKASDLAGHHALISNDEVMHYIQDIQCHSLQASQENLEFSIAASKLPDRRHYFFGIFLKDETHIGSIGFTILDKGDSGNAELGYFIHKKYWCKGYTTEAAKCVIDFGFNQVGLKKFTTGCVYDNDKSEHIMIKLGMYKEAHKKYHVYIDGEWRDRVEYGLFNPSLLSKIDQQELLIVDLARCLKGRQYHFDGSTALFVHGLKEAMGDIDITFPFEDEEAIRNLFKHYDQSETIDQGTFKHFHFKMKGEKIHCLFYQQDSETFSNEDDIEVINFVPVVYKSMSFFMRNGSDKYKNRIKAYQERL